MNYEPLEVELINRNQLFIQSESTHAKSEFGRQTRLLSLNELANEFTK